MGGSASKAARTAGGAAKRQYPTRIPPSSSPVNKPSSHATPSSTPSDAPSSFPPSAHFSAKKTSSASSPNDGPRVHPAPYASGSRDQTISSDGFDPQLAASLRKLGPVQTGPTYSPTSHASETAPGTSGPGSHPLYPPTSMNPALLVLEARQRLADEAEREASQIGKRGFEGRQFVDVMTLRRALALRDERAMDDAAIESELGLRKGIMAKLGPKGVVGDSGSSMANAFG